MEQNNNNVSPLGMVFGIISLVVSIIGGITFGIIGAGVALVCGILAIVLSVKVKKETDGAKGTGGMVMGILGIVFGALFAIGCTVCGASVMSEAGTSGGTCYGCVGFKCFVDSKTSEIQDALDKIDWGDLADQLDQ